MPLNLFPTTDETLSKAKSSQSKMSRSETVLANRSKYGKLMPLTMEEVQPQHDWLMEQFDKCIATVTNKRDREGEYIWISVAPSTVLYGGNHRQGMVSFREDNVLVGHDSEYVNRRSLGPDAFGMCFHSDDPRMPCPLEEQRIHAEQTRRRAEEFALQQQRAAVQVTLNGREPRSIILPVAQRFRPADGVVESHLETIRWDPYTDYLRDIIIYKAHYNGQAFQYSFPTEAWIHTTDAQLMRTLRDHTAGILANER